jgi:integral membrane protein (TIGR00529 family)
MGLPGDTLLAFGKLIFIFCCMLVMLRMKIQLWKAIVAGSALIALLTRTSPEIWIRVPLDTLRSGEFLNMEIMLLGILLLSGLQGASGQSSRLVAGLEHYLRWPRIRLMIFPALVGLLPMPGGALFSCPMLDAASHGLEIGPKSKTLINYWFRHIWEVSWPLYPGYILVSSLLNLPLHSLLTYTAPLVLFSFLTGWFFYLRKVDVPDMPPSVEKKEPSPPGGFAGNVLYEALPLLITLGGAVVFSFIFKYAAPALPPQTAFIASLACALSVALLQARGKMQKSLREVILNRQNLVLMLLIYTIFVFKNIIGASGIVAQLSHFGNNLLLVYSIFILLPLICGMLTGVMVGYVGACFPILLGILAETGLQAQTLPLIVMAVVAGNVGQMATPLHVCMAVTCEYYKVHFADIWRDLLPALLVQLGYGALWCLLLYFTGASFY